MSLNSLDQDKFDAAVASLSTGALAPIRAQAAKLFSATGFPTARNEDWKYTNLSTATSVSNAWLATHTAANSELPDIDPTQLQALQQIEADWLLVRNGTFDSEAAQTLDLQDGLNIKRFTEGDDLPDIDVDTPLSAFNAALLEDGIRISVAANVLIERPLGILLVDDPSRHVSQPRVIIEAAANSKLQVIELSVSNSSGEQYTNSVVQLDLATDANVDYVRVQDRDLQHISTNRLIAQLEDKATLSHFTVDVGGNLTRNDIVARINGADAQVNLQGLYLATDRQHIDNHTRVEHRVGPAISHESYRGILGGRSRGVFNGQAIVFAGADGTDANQENHNLLLSDLAEIDTKPELEIYADDVKCSHGATVGQLDEAALFYLLSRGLNKDEARQLLTKSFAATVVDKLYIDEASAFVQTLVDNSLARILASESQ